MKWLAQGPRQDVIKYPGYIINGFRFQTKVRDDSRVTQNSGVSIVANAMEFSSAKDMKPVVSDMCFYGVITEIWLLDYFMFQIPLFKCDWVDNKKGIKVDELGFVLVELGRVGHKGDPFILATQATKQVFYVPDQLDPKWSIALETPRRDYHDEYNEDEIVDFCIGDEICTKVLPRAESFDMLDESRSTYARENGEGTWVDHTKS